MKVIARAERKHYIGGSDRVWKEPKYLSFHMAPKGAEI